MVRIEMSPEKTAMLREALVSYLSELHLEITRTHSAVTVTPAKMLTIQSPDFSCLIHKTPRLGIKVMANLAQVVAGRLAQFKGVL
jgi:hypothetical protein